MEVAEERMSDPKDRAEWSIQSKEQREKTGKENKGSLRYLWDSIKDTSMYVMEVPGEEERKW